MNSKKKPHTDVKKIIESCQPKEIKHSAMPAKKSEPNPNPNYVPPAFRKPNK